MTPILVVSLAAGGLATLAVFQLVRPVLGGRMVWPAAGAAIASAVATLLIGVLSGTASIDYFVGISAFAFPVLVMLEAAAIGSGADAVARWTLMLGWGVLVVPVVATVPLLVTQACGINDCGFEDFGGALPLFVSSSMFLLLAWVPAGSRPPLDRGALGRPAALSAILLFWLAFITWLASLEGAIDDYTPRILLSGIVAPAAAALGWLLTDRLRNVRRRAVRSLGSGLIAGMAAIAPGAVAVSFPWSLAVGGLAGIAAARIHSAPVGQLAGVATRWGLTMAVATAVGFLAPPISGDTVGVLFSARVSVLVVPALVFVGVAFYSILVSAPVWVFLRRRAAVRDRRPV